MNKATAFGIPAVLTAIAGLLAVGVSASPPIGHQAVPRDAFPVFDDPEMVSVAEGESMGVVFDRDPVIGVSLNGEAKAYPVTIMGVHELGNDTVGGVPITVEW